MVMADELYMLSVGDDMPSDKIGTKVSEKEDFTCSQCSEMFEDRSTLFKHVHARHKQHVHSRRKFKCDKCERTFKSMTGLRNHARTHNDFFVLQIDATQNTSIISTSKQSAIEDDSDMVSLHSSINDDVFVNVQEKTNVSEIMNASDKLTHVKTEENKLNQNIENKTSETENDDVSDTTIVNSEYDTVTSNSRKSERRRSGIPVPVRRSLYVENDSGSPQRNETSLRNEMTGQKKCQTSSAHDKRSLSKSLHQSPFGKKFKTKAQCPHTPSRSKSALNSEQNASPLGKRKITPKSAGKCIKSSGKTRSTPKQITPRNIFTTSSNSAKKYRMDGDMFICKKCGKSFVDRAKLNVHFAIHSRETPEKCGIDKRIVKRNITNQMSAGSPFSDAVTSQIFSCQKCKQKFENEALLDKHIKSHDVKTHCCPYCEKQFRFQSSLKAHSFVHQGETPGHVTDEVVNKDGAPDIKTLSMETSSYKEDNFNVFSLMSTNSCTNDYLPFTCKSCNYSTHLPDELLSHMKTHSRTGPYTCSHCKKSYRQQSNLQVHQKIHTISKIKNIIVTNRRIKERV